MLKSDHNCMMDKCVSMSCNNSSTSTSNEIAKEKILNSSSRSSKKKKHKNKNGLINGCQQDGTKQTIIVKEKQEINGLEHNSGAKKKTTIECTILDKISQHDRDICNIFGNNIVEEEPMACCSSKIDQVGCETIINDHHQIRTDDVENLTNHFNKVDLSNVEIKELDEKRQTPPIKYVQYESELQMPMIMKIIQKDLSEPYSIYTYRYFIHNWPKLCFLAMCEDQCVGAIVCKLDIHRKSIKRGYIAMLAVDQNYRKLGIGSTLVRMAIQEMILGDADEVVLETEVTNKPALQLYEALGFVRDKRLFRYYLNGVDALRLKLWLR